MTQRDFKRINETYEPEVCVPSCDRHKFRAYFGTPPQRLRKGRTVAEIEAAYWRVYQYAHQDGPRRAWTKDPSRRYRMYWFSWAIAWLGECLDRRLADAVLARHMTPLLDSGDESYPWGVQVECCVNGRSYWYVFVGDGGSVPRLSKLSWPTQERRRMEFGAGNPD